VRSLPGANVSNTLIKK